MVTKNQMLLKVGAFSTPFARLACAYIRTESIERTNMTCYSMYDLYKSKSSYKPSMGKNKKKKKSSSLRSATTRQVKLN